MSHTLSKLPRESHRTLITGLVMAMASLVVQPCAAALPWEETFPPAGYTNNQPVNGIVDVNGNTWTASSGVKIQSADAFGGSGLAVYVPAEEGVTNDFSLGDSPTKVWIDMQVKPSRQSAYATDMPTPDADAAAFFFFNSNGYAVVRNGSSWSTNATVVGGSTLVTCTENQADYDRITVFQNYATKKWALYVNDYLVGEQLAFVNATLTAFDKFALRNGTYVDNLWVNDYYPSASESLNGELQGDGPATEGDADFDGSQDVWEMQYWDTKTAYGSGSDPDGDGKRNEEEWVNGSNPTDPGSSLWGVPYFQMFEVPVGSLSGTWRGLTVSGNVGVQASTELQGSRIMALSTATVAFTSAYFDSQQTTGTNVWVQIYAKPGVYYSGGGLPEPDTDTVASFLVERGTGNLYMYDNNAWVLADGTITQVPTNHWLGLAVHLDYTAREWDLYVSTNGTFGAVMQRANDLPLGMHADASGVTAFTGFEVDTELPAYVDAVAVSPAYEACNNTDTNLVVQDRLADEVQYVTLPPKNYDADEVNVPRTDKLEGTLGDDLSRGLKVNVSVARADRVLLYNGNWNQAYQQSIGNWTGPGVNVAVDNGDGVIIDREPGADYAAFYPFQSDDESSLEPQPIMGSGDGYWALLNNPVAAPPRTMVDGDGGAWNFGSPTAQQFDQIWIYRNGRYINLWYSGLQGWKRGSRLASETLYPSETFWYFRRSSENGFWQPM